MKRSIRIPLQPAPQQHARLLALQSTFARVCNELAPLVQKTGVWNRVALHHMAYKNLREQFPALGSQMVCNAIYAVSRTSRLIFQTAGSPFHVARMAGRPLPLLRFTDTCPVYFDRHTLSLKQGQISLFTLDGRMKFQLALGAEDEAAFHMHKLLEVVLRRKSSQFELAFQFGPPINALTNQAPPKEHDEGVADLPVVEPPVSLPQPLQIPDYLQLEEIA